MKSLALPLIRQAVQLLAGVLITAGYVRENEAEFIVGGTISILTAAWMVFARLRGK